MSLLVLSQALEIEFVSPSSIPQVVQLFSGFFLLFFFPGVEMGGMSSLSAVTKSTRTLSDALWEPHISILSHFI